MTTRKLQTSNDSIWCPKNTISDKNTATSTASNSSVDPTEFTWSTFGNNVEALDQYSSVSEPKTIHRQETLMNPQPQESWEPHPESTRGSHHQESWECHPPETWEPRCKEKMTEKSTSLIDCDSPTNNEPTGRPKVNVAFVKRILPKYKGPDIRHDRLSNKESRADTNQCFLQENTIEAHNQLLLSNTLTSEENDKSQIPTSHAAHTEDITLKSYPFTLLPVEVAPGLIITLSCSLEDPIPDIVKDYCRTHSIVMSKDFQLKLCAQLNCLFNEKKHDYAALIN
ncbi:hypothetical protein BDB01DRAFT_778712 [Pilobolus umbonatus]|nr:hypothetical protein BDB01DRAFT_778712 [Pilobolus umbonatus]